MSVHIHVIHLGKHIATILIREFVPALSALVECRLSLVCWTHLQFEVSRDRIANGKQVKNWPSSAEGSVANLSRVVFSFWMVALRTGFCYLMQKSNLWRAQNSKNLFDLDHIFDSVLTTGLCTNTSSNGSIFSSLRISCK